MSEPIYLTSIGLIFGTIVLIFAMKYLSAAYQARARKQGDDAYRDLAQKAVSAQSDSAAPLSVMQAEMAEIKTHLAAVEKILKAVE